MIIAHTKKQNINTTSIDFHTTTPALLNNITEASNTLTKAITISHRRPIARLLTFMISIRLVHTTVYTNANNVDQIVVVIAKAE
jgi:hypothetical protein